VRAALVAGSVVLLAAGLRAVPPMPERLSETGLYLPGTQTVDPRNRPYSPQYPLWTDGATKARWVHLPAGARIDAREADGWTFPVGTTFWKEFSFAGRKVETRMLRRTSAGRWSYASYVWNDAQTEATLAPAQGVPAVAEVAPGKRHDIPGREDCRACHENGQTPALGFTALQLSDDRDPAAPHAEALQPGMLTLRTLMTEQLFEPGSQLSPAHAPQAPRIAGDPQTRAALGYLTGNCGHCHNEQSPVATVRFPLRATGFFDAAQTGDVVGRLLARVTDWDLPGREPGTSSMITPGAPDLSVLLVRMRSRRPSTQMPPLGTVLPDREAVELIATWIASMPRR
jgi:hypothetical protein